MAQKRAKAVQKVVFPTDLKRARDVADDLLAEIEAYGYKADALFAIKLSVEEALINAARHGNREDPTKSITVEYAVDDRQVAVRVIDEGDGFDPTDVPDPTADENLERPSGRGIMLMRTYMDQLEYNERGNALRMVKYRR
jgi:serine/threonine-protein kinase RsbW